MAYREITGEEKVARPVTVTIRQDTLVDRVLDIFYERNKKFYGNFIDDKGVWNTYSYTHPHNNDDVYDKGDKATEEELVLKGHLEFIQSLRF